MIDKKFEPYDITWWLVVVALLISVSFIKVYAGEDKDCRQGHKQCGHNDNGDVVVDVGGQQQDQGQNQQQYQSQSSDQANQQAVTFNSARRAPTNFLYMQNQVEACGRTFGFSGSNTSGGWAFGIPIPRSWTPTCDLWKAAEEAQQNGFVFTSYMFQCSIKTVRKVLGDATCDAFEKKALIELGLFVEDLNHDDSEGHDESTSLLISHDEYHELMAEVPRKEYEEQQQMIEDKFAQYDNLIQVNQEKSADDDDKIAALEQRIEDEVGEVNARRAAIRAKYETKRQEKADEPESPDQ